VSAFDEFDNFIDARGSSESVSDLEELSPQFDVCIDFDWSFDDAHNLRLAAQEIKNPEVNQSWRNARFSIRFTWRKKLL
jgi:hypothetical protein